MKACIVKGKIRVKFEDPDPLSWIQQRDEVLTAIGSANAVGELVPIVSCMSSPQNLRKLRLMGCKLSRDDETTAAIAVMREERDVFEEEIRQGDLAKKTTTPVTDYLFKKPPFDHQVLGFNFLHSMLAPALFGDCGTGKTFIVLTFGDSLIQAGEKWVFLVVCPVNLISHVWIADTATFTDRTCIGLREEDSPQILGEDWDDPKDPEMKFMARAALRKSRKGDKEWKARAKRRAQARHRKKLQDRFAQEADFYAVNPENLRTDSKEKRVKELIKRKKKEGYSICLVIDESSKLKSRTSRTYKSLKRLRAFCKRCIIMTGTPSPNGILDLWAQFSVLDNGQTLQPSFTDYRNDVAKEVILKYVKYKSKSTGEEFNGKKWNPKPGAAIRVYQTLKGRMIRFRTEDCIDLPPKRFLIRDVQMNKQQLAAYEDMENMLFTELEGESVTAKIAATKMLKLRQITGGFIRTDEGEDIPLGKDSPKMLELDELLEQSIADKIGDDGPPNKALIWAQYQWECKALVKRYSKQYGARGLFGGISSKAKDNAIAKFKRDPNARVLVCHPGSVGHGLTLVEANFFFYYSLSYNFEEFYQSFRRGARHGQKRNMTFFFLVCPQTIDEELLEVVRTKKDLSDIITDGEFSRNQIIAKRGKAPNQIEVDWEVTNAATEGHPPEENQ
jgi:SNF2 family DNA or RNA helicase